jgi:hypothetical protein
MSFEKPRGSEIQKFAAWEAITASIILFFMTAYKFLQIRYGSQPGASMLPTIINKVIVSVMGENELAHASLYLVVFVLVFSSAIMGYFYNDNK